MRSRLSAAAVTFLVLATLPLHAQGSRDVDGRAEEFEAKLGYQTGTVSLRGGMATLRLPESFRFIGPEGSRRLLTEGWGNPPAAANRVLGMLIPTAASPLSRDGWGIVITYEEEGYVNDSDAASIDYSKMLAEMRESLAETNTRARSRASKR
jgi:uncharacterized membrane-anchored protein